MTAGADVVVLDTNVVSELMRTAPEPRVARWVSAWPPAAVHTTAVTLAEVAAGIAVLPAGARRDALGRAAARVFDALPDRVLPFDAVAASAYAAVVAGRRRRGAPISTADAQIAAIVRSRGGGAARVVLATRNVEDFAGLGLVTADPWTATGSTEVPPNV